KGPLLSSKDCGRRSGPALDGAGKTGPGSGASGAFSVGSAGLLVGGTEAGGGVWAGLGSGPSANMKTAAQNTLSLALRTMAQLPLEQCVTHLRQNERPYPDGIVRARAT